MQLGEGGAKMHGRRNDHDVTNRVRTTDPVQVEAAIVRLFHSIFPQSSAAIIRRAIADIARLYRGQYPGYAACDTDYHNLQHTLDVTLAMCRIMAGYIRAGNGARIAPDLFVFGILAALFHDAGYIRRRGDRRHANGAEYTKVHVARGSKLLRDYLPQVGMERFVTAAAPTLHFTGYERAAERIRVPEPIFRLIGNMLGSADIIAQMSDRCYLEKCYERLYPEFVLGGIDRKFGPEGKEQTVFASAEDLVFRTPQFYLNAMKRLQRQLDAVMRFAAAQPGGRNLYLEETEKNVRYAGKLAACGDVSALRRRPPRMDQEATKGSSK